MKILLFILIIYFVYRFWFKRQNSLSGRQSKDAELGEYIDYEEIEEDK